MRAVVIAISVLCVCILGVVAGIWFSSALAVDQVGRPATVRSFALERNCAVQCDGSPVLKEVASPAFAIWKNPANGKWERKVSP